MIASKLAEATGKPSWSMSRKLYLRVLRSIIATMVVEDGGCSLTELARVSGLKRVVASGFSLSM